MNIFNAILKTVIAPVEVPLKVIGDVIDGDGIVESVAGETADKLADIAEN